MKNEIWVDIKGYEGLYQISNKGNVKRLSGYCSSKADSSRFVRERLLKCFPNKTRGNYLYVNLNKSGIKQFRVHKLVALHFIPNPKQYNEVNHINGNKNDNTVENLEWCNRLQNMKHSYEIGTHKIRKGNKAPNTKLNDKQVDEIRQKLKEGYTGVELASEYNVSGGMISLIKHNKNW